MILHESTEGPGAVDQQRLSGAALRVGVWSWALVMLIGQWLFLYYLLALYGVATATGNIEDWNRAGLFKGHIPGDAPGNLAFGAHVLLSTIIMFGSMLQLVPQIRARAIAFHRWNGRAFLLAAVTVSLAGLYMVWVRDATFEPVNKVAVTIDGVLILVFVAVAWRAARAGDIARHRRWALRTFMVVNAVFFIRIFSSGWVVFTDGAGMTDDMDGPMNHFFQFAQFLLPLAVLELYLRARASARPLLRFATALVLLLGAVYMGAGEVRHLTKKFSLLA
jgi:uncharacterized membrane protein